MSNSDLVVKNDVSALVKIEIPDDVMQEIAEDIQNGHFQLPTVEIDHKKAQLIMPDGRMVDRFSGVILGGESRRACWILRAGTGEDGALPDCVSTDLKVGSAEAAEDMDFKENVVQVFGACERCWFNEFRSAISESGDAGSGKRCRIRRTLLVWPWEVKTLSPWKIPLSPTGLRSDTQSWAEYDAGAQISTFSCSVRNMLVEFYLEKRGSSGVPTARLKARVLGGLGDGTISPEHRTALAVLSHNFLPLIGFNAEEGSVEAPAGPPLENAGQAGSGE